MPAMAKAIPLGTRSASARRMITSQAPTPSTPTAATACQRISCGTVRETIRGKSTGSISISPGNRANTGGAARCSCRAASVNPAM